MDKDGQGEETALLAFFIMVGTPKANVQNQRARKTGSHLLAQIVSFSRGDLTEVGTIFSSGNLLQSQYDWCYLGL
jgi:hypothetical protein